MGKLSFPSFCGTEKLGLDCKRGSMRSVKISTQNDQKFCPIYFGTCFVNALIDTGAEISLMREDVFNRIPSENVFEHSPPTCSLWGVTGHQLEVSEKVVVKFRLGHSQVKHEVHVVKDMAKQMILGIDFLENHKVKLDFEKKTLAVGKEIILLQAGKAVIRSDCALVLTKEKHLIRPLSSGMIAVNLGLQRKQRKGYHL